MTAGKLHINAGLLARYGWDAVTNPDTTKKGRLIKYPPHYPAYPSIPLVTPFPLGASQHASPGRLLRQPSQPMVFLMPDNTGSMTSPVPAPPEPHTFYDPQLRIRLEIYIATVVTPLIDSFGLPAWRIRHKPVYPATANEEGFPNGEWWIDAISTLTVGAGTLPPSNSRYLNHSAGDVLVICFQNEAGGAYYSQTDAFGGIYTPGFGSFDPEIPVNVFLPPGNLQQINNFRSFRMHMYILPIFKVAGAPFETDDFGEPQTLVFQQHVSEIVNATGNHAGIPRLANFGVTFSLGSGNMSNMTASIANLLTNWLATVPSPGFFDTDGSTIP